MDTQFRVTIGCDIARACRCAVFSEWIMHPKVNASALIATVDTTGSPSSFHGEPQDAIPIGWSFAIRLHDLP